MKLKFVNLSSLKELQLSSESDGRATADESQTKAYGVKTEEPKERIPKSIFMLIQDGGEEE